MTTAILNEEQLALIRESLQAQLGECDAVIEAQQDTMRVIREQGLFADASSQETIRAALVSMSEAEEQRAAIVQALARMEEGRFGVCASCSRPIPFERLEARPVGVTCVSCLSAA